MAKVTMNSLPPVLTPQEIAELDALENLPVLCDEDCPEMNREQLAQFHRMDSVMIKVSPSNMKKVKALGPDSQKILIRLFDLAINDAELMKKCI